ncbi:MAG: adenylyl-sulfate reductase [Gammaproteobacteria bacterium]|nr:adenylyl-sulfate reductase [Gammaproteobacteria bacterium]
MLTTNPFSELALSISPGIMQTFVIVMVLLVIGGTIFDVIHKKSAKYFFENMKRSKSNGIKSVNGGEKASIAVKTIAEDVLTSAEFCSTKRRIAHLLTMYGFILFAVSTAVMIFSYSDAGAATPQIWPILWHVGAFAVCLGGYWFWFFIRVDVAAEGNSPFRLMKADLFVLSLIATTTFALLWSILQSSGGDVWATIMFVLFVLSTIVLFGGVPWSKFAHMFFKPAAAFEKRLSVADGSRNNLPQPADAPAKFGLGIKRDLPRHY